MLSQEQSKTKRIEPKQRNPGFVVSNEAAVTPGRTAKPQEVVISQAVRKLNKDGYYVYNTPEREDIYICIQPETAIFDDEDPGMIRMAGGSFVGKSKNANVPAIQVRQEHEQEQIVYTQPADIFYNASRRERLDEIDFDEIILKSHKPEPETILRETFFKPFSEEISDPIMEGTFMKGTPAVVLTASAEAVQEEVSEKPLEGYDETPEYEVHEESTDRPQVTDVPAGLYVEGHKETNPAESDVGKAAEPSFIEMSPVAEVAVTLVSEPIDIVEPISVNLPAEEYQSLSIPVKEECVSETSGEVISETVAKPPEFIEVTDLTADIMKLTIPGLYIDEYLLSELSIGRETMIPDDGLEAYDCMFA